jgi:menaquinone-dependent protoporphyrinogen oxidase
MAKILILFSSVDGHTFKIANKIKNILASNDHEIDIISVDDYPMINTDYDFILIGASIRYGNYRKSLYRFINDNISVLKNVKTAFFSVNATARKAGKDNPETDRYVQKFKTKSGWNPDFVAIFAGVIDYPKYSFFDRMMIRFIMFLTHGPTDSSSTFEFTDWRKVDSFGIQLSSNLKHS